MEKPTKEQWVKWYAYKSNKEKWIEEEHEKEELERNKIMKTKPTRVWDANKDDLLDTLYILLAMIPLSALIWYIINL